MRTPHARRQEVLEGPDGLMQQFALLEREREGEDIDWQRRRVLESTLLSHFVASPEAARNVMKDFVSIALELAAEFMGQTVATLTPPQLHDIVVGRLPRKVQIAAAHASEITAEPRAFYLYLQRVYALKQPRSRFNVLDESTTQRLGAKLFDGNTSTLAKAMVEGAARGGSNVRAVEGIDRYMQARKGPTGRR